MYWHLPSTSIHGDGGLLVEAVDDVHHLLGLNDYLGGAVEVPEDDEGEVLAHLPDVLHPAGELHLLTHVLQPELAAGMGTVLCHDDPSFL